MRRRVVRELVTVAGVVVILLALVVFNSQVSRGGKKERMEQYRRTVETQRETEGQSLLKWDQMRQTKRANSSSAPIFADDLSALDGKEVTLLGFMAPIDQFQDVSYFMLLPVPIECFFCSAPPMREIMYVELVQGKRADIVNEPVAITGTLTLSREAGSQFFYSIKDAQWAAGEKNTKLTPKNTGSEHRMHQMQQGLSRSGVGTAAPAGS